MIKKTYHWKLHNITNGSSVMRYCHNCGRKVIFRDSEKRRRNANGKTIYEYAIYKCEKDHTWNLLVNTYKAVNSMDHFNLKNYNIPEMISFEIISLIDQKNEGIGEIEIILEEVTGKWRIDKLLSGCVPQPCKAATGAPVIVPENNV
jgi:hypothetical protein